MVFPTSLKSNSICLSTPACPPKYFPAGSIPINGKQHWSAWPLWHPLQTIAWIRVRSSMLWSMGLFSKAYQWVGDSEQDTRRLSSIPHPRHKAEATGSSRTVSPTLRDRIRFKTRNFTHYQKIAVSNRALPWQKMSATRSVLAIMVLLRPWNQIWLPFPVYWLRSWLFPYAKTLKMLSRRALVLRDPPRLVIVIAAWLIIYLGFQSPEWSNLIKGRSGLSMASSCNCTLAWEKKRLRIIHLHSSTEFLTSEEFSEVKKFIRNRWPRDLVPGFWDSAGGRWRPTRSVLTLELCLWTDQSGQLNSSCFFAPSSILSGLREVGDYQMHLCFCVGDSPTIP